MRNTEMGDDRDQDKVETVTFVCYLSRYQKNDKVKDQNPLKQSETENKGHESSTTVCVGDIRNGREKTERCNPPKWTDACEKMRGTQSKSSQSLAIGDGSKSSHKFIIENQKSRVERAGGGEKVSTPHCLICVCSIRDVWETNDGQIRVGQTTHSLDSSTIAVP